MCNNEENKEGCKCDKEEDEKKKGKTIDKDIILMALCLGTLVVIALIGKFMG